MQHFCKSNEKLKHAIKQGILTLSRRRPLSYRNQSIDLLLKSVDWFLYDKGLRHERVKDIWICRKVPDEAKFTVHKKD